MKGGCPYNSGPRRSSKTMYKFVLYESPPLDDGFTVEYNFEDEIMYRENGETNRYV